MPELRERSRSTLIGGARDLLATLKEGMFVAVIVTLFIWPSYIKSVLADAGVTEVSIAGLKWEQRLLDANQDTTEARDTISELTANLDNVEEKLKEIASQRPEEAKTSARELSLNVRDLKFKAQRADSKLEHGIAVQKSMINQITTSKLRRPVRNEK